MKQHIVLAAFLLAAAASGQWLETSIPVGDSPMGVCCALTERKVYVGNFAAGSISVISTSNNQVTGTVHVGSDPRRLRYCSTVRKVYCTYYDTPAVTAIDCLTDSVVANPGITAYYGELCVAPVFGLVCVTGVTCDTVWIISGITNQVVSRTWVGDAAGGLACSELRRKLYCGLSDGTLSVVNIESGSVIGNVGLGVRSEYACADAAGDFVYCCGHYETSTVVVDCRTDSVVARLATGCASDVIYNPVAGRAYVACRDSNRVLVIDGQSHAIVRTVATNAGPYSFCLDEVANKVYLLCVDSDTVDVINCRSDSIVSRIRVGDRPVRAAWSPVDRRVYVTNTGSSTVSVIRDTAHAVGVAEPTASLDQSGGGATVHNGTGAGELYDAMGRRVTEPKAGVCFLRAPGTAGARKVIIAR
jgi:YVTN family beta-propeller protein